MQKSIMMRSNNNRDDVLIMTNHEQHFISAKVRESTLGDHDREEDTSDAKWEL
jgi:hypothetical protein